MKHDDDRAATVQCQNTTDCTTEIQAALSNPKLQHITIPSGKSPWNTLPLVLSRSNVVLILEPGLILQARRGFYRGGGDVLLTVQVHTPGDSCNVAVRPRSYRMPPRITYTDVHDSIPMPIY
jgi:hypothetical protein